MRVYLLLLIFLSSLALNTLAQEPQIINRSDNPKYQKDIAITIDMCPSTRKMNNELYAYLERLGSKLHKPLPVAIALSGKWITKHDKELEKIERMYLDVTWINHSYSHPVEDDFCDNPKINFTREVVSTLDLFHKHRLKASRFFRFPGLRYNPERLSELNHLGFVALGADAWLAKGQKIKGGSIVLVHGNGNELQGDRALISYLKQHTKEILAHQLQIVPVETYLN